MKSTVSEFNLSSNPNENGVKASNSTSDLLSQSNLNGEAAEANEEAPDVAKKSARRSGRPKTFM